MMPPHNFARSSNIAMRKFNSERPTCESLATSSAFSRARSLNLSILAPSSRIDRSMAESWAMMRRRDSSQLEYSSVSCIGIFICCFRASLRLVFVGDFSGARRKANERQDKETLRHDHAAEGDFDRELMAVVADPDQVQTHTHGVGAAADIVPVEHLTIVDMARPIAIGQKVFHHLADDFGAMIAEHELGSFVEQHDLAVRVGDDERIGQCLHHRVHKGEDREAVLLFRGFPLVQFDQAVYWDCQTRGTPRPYWAGLVSKRFSAGRRRLSLRRRRGLI